MPATLPAHTHKKEHSQSFFVAGVRYRLFYICTCFDVFASRSPSIDGNIVYGTGMTLIEPTRHPLLLRLHRVANTLSELLEVHKSRDIRIQKSVRGGRATALSSVTSL